MESRAGFAQVSMELLRNPANNTADTGTIPTPSTAQETNGPANRGIEANTNRGVHLGAPQISGVTNIEYGANSDAPVVDQFKVHGDI